MTWGFGYLNSNRDETNLKSLPKWGERSHRAYENLKSYFPAFAVAILILAVQGKSDSGIAWAALSYVAARVVHFIAYLVGVVAPRSLAWTVGMIANGYLLIRTVVA